MKAFRSNNSVVYEVLDWEEPDFIFEEGGGVKYKGYKLEGLWSDSQHGRLLYHLATYDTESRFLDDATIARLIECEPTQRSIGFVLNNLKKHLKKLGLRPIIKRKEADGGYAFLRMEELDERYFPPLEIPVTE